MPEKKLILVVDDEPFNQQILEDILEDEYELTFANNGQECLEMMNQVCPNLILLDVNMPIMDGLQTCQRLRDNPQNNNLPIIFISALATEEERLQGYRAGGDDYVTKPFSSTVLLNKIELILENQDKLQVLNEQLIGTQEALQTSFASTGELTEIIQFLRESSRYDDLEELIRSVFSVMQSMNLTSCLSISAFEPTQYHSSERQLSSEDVKLINLHKDNERIITIGNNLIFNTPSATLLIKNLPEDEAVVGRYRDNFAILADGLNARIQNIAYEKEMQGQKSSLTSLVKHTKVSLNQVSKTTETHRIEHTKILSDLAQDVEELFFNLGLTETQEKAIMNEIDKIEQETENLYEEGVKTDLEFNQVVDKLNDAISNKA